ncbi:MAG TPA: TIGR04086 family membrane protein [Oscillospiraceae bacterium]|nr:TIGR04086 family membrane protein [Oscillospiraceae bacterium]
MKSGRERSENSVINVLRPIVFGAVGGSFICAVLLAICALGFVSSKHLPQGIIQSLVLAIVAISAFFAGYIAAKISHARGLMFGALAALVLFLLFFICGLIVANESITLTTLLRLVIMMIVGAIGGIAAVNKKSKNK